MWFYSMGLAGRWEKGSAINDATGVAYPVETFIHPITGSEEVVHLPVGDLELRVTMFTRPGDPDYRMIGGYLFIANARLTPNAFSVRRLAYNFRDTHAYFCKLQFSRQVWSASRTDDELISEYVEMVEEIMVGLLPELMRMLPDWPEYESASQTE